MEENTIDKYEEVLSKVKPLYERAKKENCPIWSTYEYLFPELAESEYERMIRKITAVLTNTPTEILIRERIKFCECNDWLEKQKEQKPRRVERGG